MEKRLLLFLFAMLTTVSTWAYFEVDGIYYSRITETTVAVSRSASGSYSGDVVIPSSVTYEGTTYSVTSIGDWAFEGCSSLTSVEIPSSVTEIGVRAFSDCRGLTSITIPSSVTSIGDWAFEGCSSLTSVEIPSSVTRIGVCAFSDCDNLTYNTYFNAKYLGNDDNPYLVLIEATSKEITECKVSNDTRFISSNAFKNCSNLTSVEIPSSVTSIGYVAFPGCDNLKYNEYDNGLYLGNSENPYLYLVKAKSNEITSVKINDKTRVIADAFSGCIGLTSVEIPSGVTEIGERAFSGCSSLTSVTIPSSVTSMGDYAFSDCIGLTSVEIPSGVTEIGERAFSGCSSLTSVTIPSSVTDWWNTFEYCRVARINYTGTLEEWCNIQWNPLAISSSYDLYINGNKVEELEIPSSVTEIGDWAFMGCRSLTSVVIPSSVTEISDEVFSSSGLRSITIPSSVTWIGFMFSPRNFMRINYTGSLEEWCNKRWNPRSLTDSYDLYIDGKKVEEVKIPSSVTEISDYAFEGCSSLTSVEIPSSVTSIGDYVFYGCDNLTYNEYDNGLYLGNSDNPYLCLVKAKSKEITSVNINDKTSIICSAFPGCSGLTSVDIPSSVTSIGYGAFDGCSGLTSVDIPSSVTSIGDRVFDGCSSLTSVTIPSSVTYIGDWAFSCSGLTSVEIPSSVTEVGKGAFCGCQNLRSVRIEAENPPSMSITSAFDDYTINAIYIPDGTTEAYKTALGTWYDGTYPNYIEFGKLPELENTPGGNAIVVAVDGNEVTLDIKLDEGFTLGQIIVNGVVVYPTINKALMPVTVTDLGGGKYLVSGVTNADYIKVVYSDGNDTPTAIENITILRPVREGIYNLQGQKLTAPQRGINIIEGKKVIVK